MLDRQELTQDFADYAETDTPSPASDYRLTTAEILYHLPDQPHLLNTFVWQDYDVAPEFPELQRFLAFWEENMGGTLHSVRVSALEAERPEGLVFGETRYTVH